jgi:methionyl aminopeptidase
MVTKIKTPVEIAALRESGQMLATVLNVLQAQIEIGMVTKDLAEIAKQTLKPLGGQPTFLGYQGFPDVICISVNDEVVHGIPSPFRVLKDGDIVSLDFGVTYQGMITDSALTVGLGNVSSAAKKLMETTQRSLDAGINVVKGNIKTGQIGAAVQKVLDAGHYGIIKDLVGHGVGHNLHEDPNIPNYGVEGSGTTLKSGMSIAIEPMATLGDFRVKTDTNGWTIRTVDSSLAAHFEHTLLVTDDGCEVLTKV